MVPFAHEFDRKAFADLWGGDPADRRSIQRRLQPGPMWRSFARPFRVWAFKSKGLQTQAHDAAAVADDTLTSDQTSPARRIAAPDDQARVAAHPGRDGRSKLHAQAVTGPQYLRDRAAAEPA